VADFAISCVEIWVLLLQCQFYIGSLTIIFTTRVFGWLV